MVFFFYVVGLEIRRELSMGELTDKREAAIPAIAALAGMAVPALVFLAFNAGGDAARGWGIVMATDIAFVLGALALLGPRCPSSLRIFLLTLAIVDDIGAITVIAVFYSDGLDVAWAVGAGAGVLAVVVLRRVRVRYLPVYVVLGLGTWLATFESGVHATIAGVVLGLLAPARPFLNEVDADRVADELSTERQVTPVEVRVVSFRIRESVPVTERLQDLLHPWTSYLIVVTGHAFADPAVMVRDANALFRDGFRRMAQTTELAETG